MTIRWDWLNQVMTAPYLPTLGPVHPLAISPVLLTDIIEIAGTGQFLPHDKELRWAERKDEHVLTHAISQDPGLLLIPTLSTRRNCAKVLIYSHDPHTALARAADLCARLRADTQAVRARLLWFLPPGCEPDPTAHCTWIQMRTFDQSDPAPAPGVVPLEELTARARMTFTEFAEKLAGDGFAFLDERIRTGGTGPVLTCQRDEKIAGAIGPMEILPDARGCPCLVPQYFGVLPEYRGLGLGRSLWRAAMHWGHQHNAAYQLLQTEVHGASDHLCRSEGLTDLGLVCTTRV